MRCCINCFDAKEPRIIIAQNGQIADCDFCDSEDVATMESSELRGLFEPILEYYSSTLDYGAYCLEPDFDPLNHRRYLGDLLQQDWKIFSDSVKSLDKCNELIEAIFENAIDAHQLWSKIEDCWYVGPHEDRNAWNKLVWHLRTQRRFFLDFSKLGINDFIESLAVIFEEFKDILPKETIIYRARLGGERGHGNEIYPFSKDKMGAPPSDARHQGRGNPTGISYLYAASDAETAVSEKHPGRKSLLSLAELETKRDLRLINLAIVTNLDSPFGVESLAYEIRKRTFLRLLNDELSRPVSVEDSPNEYLPSQFLCEHILNCGYDGVIYSSGYGSGQNYLLFSTDAAEPRMVRLVEVKDVKICLEFGILYDAWKERLK